MAQAFTIFELAAEAAFSNMREGGPTNAKGHYETARLNLFRAIESAHRAGLATDAGRLTLRLAQMQQVYNRQFRAG